MKYFPQDPGNGARHPYSAGRRNRRIEGSWVPHNLLWLSFRRGASFRRCDRLDIKSLVFPGDFQRMSIRQKSGHVVAELYEVVRYCAEQNVSIETPEMDLN